MKIAKKCFVIALLSTLWSAGAQAKENGLLAETWYYGLNYYAYEEPDIQVTQKSRLPSITVGYRNHKAIVKKNPNEGSVTAELAYGLNKYTGSGTLDTSYIKFLGEFYRPVYEKLYIGMGYRYLLDPSSGKFSSTGAAGYDRESQYFYVPIGATFDVDTGILKTQFNYLLVGKQDSSLSDIPGYGNDAKNTQKKGYGLDVSYAPKSGSWEVYWRYWKIADSDIVNLYSSNGAHIGYGMEPKNTTNEIGVRFAF